MSAGDRESAVRTERWLRRLLRAYPRSFRERYGDEWVATLRRQRSESRYAGALGGLRFWMEVTADSVATGLGQRWLEGTESRSEGRTTMSMDAIAQGARISFRRLLRSPGFTFVVLLTLGLGIGANTAIFSVVNAVLLRPLPYQEPDRLVVLNHYYPSLNGLEAPVSARGYRDYSTQLRAFESIGVSTGWGASLTGEGDPERLTGAQASSRYFETLGVDALRGRTFGSEVESGDAAVVVLSHGLWERRFGSDPQMVGRTLQLNGEPYAVVGIMPTDFQDPFNRNVDVWSPLVLTEEHFSRSYTNEYLNAVARVDEDADIGRAVQEASAFAERLKVELPDQFMSDWTIRATPLQELAVRGIATAVWVLMGAVAFVLLIACANVANLLLARSVGRRREMAVRMAVGAGRRQVLAELIMDGVVLGLAGAVTGGLLGAAGLAGLKVATATTVPRLSDVDLDGTVLAFTLSVSLLTGVLVALAPALGAARTQVQSTLRDGDRGGSDRAGLALRRLFVVAQFGLALALLAGAGLLIRSMSRLMAVDPGFEPEGVVAFHLALPTARYPDVEARRAFFDGVFAQLEALPGVQAAGGTSVLPFSGGWSTGSFEVEGYTPAEGEPNPWGDIRIVSSGFHEALGVPLLAGRFLEPSDGPDTRQVAVVDEVLAQRFWPGEDAIGKRLRFGPDWIDVVGVVGHAAHEGLDADPRVQVYGSYRQFDQSGMWIAVRSAGSAQAAVPGVRDVVRRADPLLPLARLATMERLIEESVGERRVSMLLLGVFAAVALLLAATGVYGVMSQNVGQRTRELGVRIAMGADRGEVLRLVLKQGMGLAAIGIGVGLIGTAALTRFIRSQLFGIEPTDPATLLSVTALLALVAAMATLLPALRATRVDPVSALRQE